MEFKYAFKQVDSFSKMSCLYEVIDTETNEPVTTMVFGYYANKEHFFICQAGALWTEERNFGTKNRTHDSIVFRRIIKEMIDLFNLFGTDFLKPEKFPESFIRERHEVQCDPIFLYSSELEVYKNNDYNERLLTNEEYIDTLIKEGVFEFIYAEYEDEDDDTITVDRYEIMESYGDDVYYDDSYFDIVYEEL